MIIEIAFTFINLVSLTEECQNQYTLSYYTNPTLMVSLEPYKALDCKTTNTHGLNESDSDSFDSFDDGEEDIKTRINDMKKNIFEDYIHFRGFNILNCVFEEVFRIEYKKSIFKKIPNKKYAFFTSFKYLLTQLAIFITYEEDMFRSFCGTDIDKETTILHLFVICVLDNDLHLYLKENQFVVRNESSLTEHKVVKILNAIFFPQKFIHKTNKIVKNVENNLKKVPKAFKFNKFDRIGVKLLDGKMRIYNAKYYILYNFLSEYID